MGFVARRLGDTVSVPLAECAASDEQRAALEKAGVVASIRMVDGETRDGWMLAGRDLDRQNARDLQVARATWRDEHTDEDMAQVRRLLPQTESDGEGQRHQALEALYGLGYPMAVEEAALRFRRWAIDVCGDALAGLTGWHDELDNCTDGVALAREVDAVDPALLIGLARRIRDEQTPSRRAAKS